jgi:hypothetical protein
VPDEPITTIAQRLTTGGRQDEYGHPADDFKRIADMWAVLVKVPITPQQVAMCMVALKLARLCHSPNHRDSMIDIAGYANCMDLIRQRNEEIKNGKTSKPGQPKPSDSLRE